MNASRRKILREVILARCEHFRPGRATCARGVRISDVTDEKGYLPCASARLHSIECDLYCKISPAKAGELYNKALRWFSWASRAIKERVPVESVSRKVQ